MPPELLTTLDELRDLGNTLVVVEHDAQTMRAADHLVEMGPGAGERGGEVVAEGDIEAFLAERAVADRRVSVGAPEDCDPGAAPFERGVARGSRCGSPQPARRPRGVSVACSFAA